MSAMVYCGGRPWLLRRGKRRSSIQAGGTPRDHSQVAPTGISRSGSPLDEAVVLDTPESRWHSLPMTIILILAVALAAGVIIQSRWALLLPLAFGAGVAFAIAATGHAIDDTPIPFLVVVSTLVMVGGQGLRSRGRAQVL